MLKLALILLALIAWGAWLVWQDKWGVTSLVCIPALGAAFVMQAMILRSLPRTRKDQ